MAADEPLEVCETCGRPLADADRHWSVELVGPEGYVGWTVFCSQDHAASWVADPVRAAEQAGSSDPVPAVLLDRVVAAGLVLLVVLVVGLVALGSFQLAQLLGAWR